MGWRTVSTELLVDMARHQDWADSAHWKVLHENAELLEDAEIRKRLNHMLAALRTLTTLATGGTADPAKMQEIESVEELETALRETNATLIETLRSLDLERPIALPRGPKGPWEAPAGVLLLQAITHGQHHRAQNAARMRQLGATPPMTDFVIWYALGQP